MKRLVSGRLTSEMVMRMTADAVMVNLALFLSLLMRYLWSVGVQGTLDQTLEAYAKAYLSTCWIVTPICIASFYYVGMYTIGRAYRGLGGPRRAG